MPGIRFIGRESGTLAGREAMYDVTGNMMLSQGVTIPYLDKYWTAEVFLNGCDMIKAAWRICSV